MGMLPRHYSACWPLESVIGPRTVKRSRLHRVELSAPHSLLPPAAVCVFPATLPLSGLMIHAGEEQERGRGAQKRSRGAEQSPANRSGSTSIVGIEGKGRDAVGGGGNAPIEWKPPQPQER